MGTITCRNDQADAIPSHSDSFGPLGIVRMSVIVRNLHVAEQLHDTAFGRERVPAMH